MNDYIFDKAVSYTFNKSLWYMEHVLFLWNKPGTTKKENIVSKTIYMYDYGCFAIFQ